jgi:MORN repeat protein
MRINKKDISTMFSSVVRLGDEFLNFEPYSLNTVEFREYEALLHTFHKIKSVLETILSVEFNKIEIDRYDNELSNLYNNVEEVPPTEIMSNIRKKIYKLVEEYIDISNRYKREKKYQKLPFSYPATWERLIFKNQDRVDKYITDIRLLTLEFLDLLPNIDYIELLICVFDYHQQDGSFVLYNSQSKLHSEWNIKKNNLNGISNLYYKNQKLKGEINFENGKLEGVSKFYYKNGKTQSELLFKGGKLDGISKKYYDSGLYAYLDSYNEGELISRKSYDKEGKLKFEQNYTV